jgi:hypothetical protein
MRENKKKPKLNPIPKVQNDFVMVLNTKMTLFLVNLIFVFVLFWFNIYKGMRLITTSAYPKMVIHICG